MSSLLNTPVIKSVSFNISYDDCTTDNKGNVVVVKKNILEVEEVDHCYCDAITCSDTASGVMYHFHYQREVDFSRIGEVYRVDYFKREDIDHPTPSSKWARYGDLTPDTYVVEASSGVGEMVKYYNQKDMQIREISCFLWWANFKKMDED